MEAEPLDGATSSGAADDAEEAQALVRGRFAVPRPHGEDEAGLAASAKAVVPEESPHRAGVAAGPVPPMQVGLAELTVVRHGQSVSNVAFAAAEAAGLADSGLTGRDADVQLSPLGWEQAAAVGHWLATLPSQWLPEVVLCSPYLRARQTLAAAGRTAAERGLILPPPRHHDRLRDRVMGDLELMTTAAVADRFPAEAARRGHTDEFAYRPPGPGGESFGDVADRLVDLLDDVRRQHAGRRVFVVAHDAVVLMLRFLIEGLSLADLRHIARAGPVRNASITRWTAAEGRMTLAEYNTVDHLRPHPAG